MSLKHDIAEYPEMWSKEIVSAVEDYKNGKWNSKRKLRKFVNREISEHYYNELIERYAFFHRMNRAKRERERARKIKSVISVVTILFSWLCTICYLIERDQGHFAFWYFLLWAWAFFYALSSSDDEIKKLKRENELLKERLEIYKKE